MIDGIINKLKIFMYDYKDLKQNDPQLTFNVLSCVFASQFLLMYSVNCLYEFNLLIFSLQKKH